MKDEFYYVGAEGVAGPVSRRMLEDMLKLRSIQKRTPIWYEGLAEWKPFSEIDFVSLSRSSVSESQSLQAVPPEQEFGECAFSGEKRIRSELLPYGDKLVAPEYLDQFVQHTAQKPEDERSWKREFSARSCLWQSWEILSERWLQLAMVILPLCLLSVGYSRYVSWSSGGLREATLGSELVGFLCEVVACTFALKIAHLAWHPQEQGQRPLLVGFLIALGVYAANSFVLGVTTLIGLVIFILPGFYLYCRMIFSLPLAVLEGPTCGPAALEYSWNLTAGRQWELAAYFGVFVMAYLLPLLLLGVFFFLTMDYLVPNLILEVAMTSLFPVFGIYWYCAFEHFDSAENE